MLFCRLNDADRSFWFLGPASYRSHTGEKPMAITWELATPLPGVMPPVEGGLDAVAVATMRQALADCGGNVSRAARVLGISRSTLYRRLGLGG